MIKKLIMGFVVALGFTTSANAYYTAGVYATSHNDEIGGAIINADTAFTDAKDYWLMHSGIESYSDIADAITDRTDRSNGDDFHAAVVVWLQALQGDIYIEDLISNIESQTNYQDNTLHAADIETIVNAYISNNYVAVPYTVTDAFAWHGIDRVYFDEAWTRANATEEGREYLEMLVDQWNMLTLEQRQTRPQLAEYFEADVSEYY